MSKEQSFLNGPSSTGCVPVTDERIQVLPAEYAATRDLATTRLHPKTILRPRACQQREAEYSTVYAYT